MLDAAARNPTRLGSTGRAHKAIYVDRFLDLAIRKSTGCIYESAVSR
jgi:hypothetical protein